MSVNMKATKPHHHKPRRITQSSPRTPSSIQVLWHLENAKKVWWDAEVITWNTHDSTRRHLADAKLKYRAYHGYPSTNVEVQVSDNEYLNHKDAPDIVISWPVRQSTQEDKVDQFVRRSDKYASRPTGADVSDLQGRIRVLTDKVFLMERKIALSSSLINLASRDTTGKDKLAQNVLAFLKQRLLINLQRPLRYTRRRIQDGSADAFEIQTVVIIPSCIKVQADCELHIFEAIARYAQGSLNAQYGGHFCFQPPYSHTQLPCTGAKEFRIAFHSFCILCELLGLNSTSDRINMLMKYGVAKKEGMMRILGNFVTRNSEKDGQECFFIGSSDSSDSYPKSSVNASKLKGSLVLTRANSNWIVEDKMYEAPLMVDQIGTSALTGQACSDERHIHDSCFLLEWKRLPEVKSRHWSRSSCVSDFVQGKVEVLLPCFIVTGDLLCDEFTEHLTDEASEEVVSSK